MEQDTDCDRCVQCKYPKQFYSFEIMYTMLLHPYKNIVELEKVQKGNPNIRISARNAKALGLLMQKTMAIFVGQEIQEVYTIAVCEENKEK